MARTLCAWAINRGGKNLVRNLRYGPRTRLVRGINLISRDLLKQRHIKNQERFIARRFRVISVKQKEAIWSIVKALLMCRCIYRARNRKKL